MQPGNPDIRTATDTVREWLTTHGIDMAVDEFVTWRDTFLLRACRLLSKADFHAPLMDALVNRPQLFAGEDGRLMAYPEWVEAVLSNQWHAVALSEQQRADLAAALQN